MTIKSRLCSYNLLNFFKSKKMNSIHEGAGQFPGGTLLQETYLNATTKAALAGELNLSITVVNDWLKRRKKVSSTIMMTNTTINPIKRNQCFIFIFNNEHWHFKSKKTNCILTKEQASSLEAMFSRETHPDAPTKAAIAGQLKLTTFV